MFVRGRLACLEEEIADIAPITASPAGPETSRHGVHRRRELHLPMRVQRPTLSAEQSCMPGRPTAAETVSRLIGEEG